ncbi:MAG: hypothetical protein KDC54_00560 [Lewinella sp.]|nr:hypothetical protein [Lewinella sp.]
MRLNRCFYPLFTMITLLIASTTLQAQRHPDEILIGDREVPKVLLVGTFHFAYPNLDAHKTAAEDQVDIQSQQKQAEVRELLDYLARFRPTKIVVESGPNTGYLMRRYERWQAGEEELQRNERDQLGIRLMHRMDLDTIYGCDAGSLLGDIRQNEELAPLVTYFEEQFADYDWSSDDPLDSLYTAFYDYETGLENTMPLLELFQYMNSEPVIRRYHGAYLIGDFADGDTTGPDFLSLYWYNRNLRIFRNIQALDIQPDDRILVLFGAGHSSILKQQFEATPEFELVPFSALMDWE